MPVPPSVPDMPRSELLGQQATTRDTVSGTDISPKRRRYWRHKNHVSPVLCPIAPCCWLTSWMTVGRWGSRRSGPSATGSGAPGPAHVDDQRRTLSAHTEAHLAFQNHEKVDVRQDAWCTYMDEGLLLCHDASGSADAAPRHGLPQQHTFNISHLYYPQM